MSAPLRIVPTVLATVLLISLAGAGARAEEKKPTAEVILQPTVDQAAGVLARSLVAGGLVRAGYEVVNAMAGPEDTATRAGVDLSARITLLTEVSAKDPTRSVHTLAVQAVEPSSGRLLAASKGRSDVFDSKKPEASLASIRSVGIRCRDEITKQLRAVRQVEQKQGHDYVIQFMNAPAGADIKMHGALKHICEHAQLRSSTGPNLTFRARCRMSSTDLQKGIEAAVAKKLDGAPIQTQVLGQTGLMIIFK